MWEYAAGGPVMAPIAVADGVAYVSSWNNDMLHALDASTGSVRWTTRINR